MTNDVLFSQMSSENLTQMLMLGVREELNKFKESFAPKGDKEIMTQKEVCKYLGCSKGTLYNWENDKILIPARVGKLVRYKRYDVEKLLGFDE